MRALTFLARRFVAGDKASEAVAAVRKLNEKGIKATLDFLGEECLDREHAEGAVQEVLGLLRLIAEHKVNANVSIKLTQLGLSLDMELARKNLKTILDEAARLGNFVRVDMEGSAYTQKTLDLFNEAFAKSKNTGIVIQASLLRSRADIEALNKAGARVRLCKGAYKEPPSVAHQVKEEVNANFDALARLMLDSGIYHALATHDDERIEAAIRYAKEKGIGKDRFEFQMLYGLHTKRWPELVAEGYTVRIYVPYGTHWFPYFYRRIRERKENLMFVLRNLFN